MLTAITAQNTLGVTGIHPIPIDFLEQQLETVLSDIRFDAVKIGMLHSPEVIMTVKKMLLKYPVKHIVLDPVMVATSGDTLLQNEAITVLRNELIPLATLITPNIPEAAILAGKENIQPDELPELATQMASEFGTSVLLKAGHFSDSIVTDVLYNEPLKQITQIQNTRIHTPNTHGTGCSLSSAIASYLAKGLILEDAVTKGITYLHEALVAGKNYELGKGSGPVAHFYKFWD